MTTFITGYDGSDAARAATLLTQRLARALGAGVEQVTVGDEPAARGLQRHAEARDAGLVVVGRTHHGAVGRTVIGSVGEQLVHGSSCPVAVVPAHAADGPIDTVAVAYDDRPEARAALAAGEALADRLGAQLVVLAVIEPLVVPYAGYGVPVATGALEHELAEELTTEIRRRVEEIVGDRAELRTRIGPAGRSLVDMAGESVDLLVMGSRGYGPLRGVLLGSVSRHVVDHAPCPVLVLPRGGTTAGLLGRKEAVARA